jgi:hypothetical protein
MRAGALNKHISPITLPERAVTKKLDFTTAVLLYKSSHGDGDCGSKQGP